jgi:hypothetical protein
MRPLRMNNLYALLILFALPLSAQPAVLLDDDWDDGDRTDTNLPEESAWFGSTTATLSAAPNALTGNVRIGDTLSSRLWITHFTPAGSPVELAVGDTLKLTLDFVPRAVTTSNATHSTTTRGLRFGIFNFSDPGAARVTADGFSTAAGAGAPGTNVSGYMLNMNFGQVFTINSPLQLMKRTDVTSSNLMGSTTIYSSLGSGGAATNGSPGFSNDVPYTFEFTIQRFDTSVAITTRFSDATGWSVSHSANDVASPTVRFDGFAIRPNSVVDSAEAFAFTRLKVEAIPFAVKITSIRFKDPTVLELIWDSLPGKTYEVHWRTGLEPANTWNTLGTLSAQGATISIEDRDAPYEPQRFYRVFQLQ